MSFFEHLKKYKNLNRTSFHTPGHKCNVKEFSSLLDYDLTELPLTDSLYEADGIIAELENEISELYSSEKSLISCGGNTLCIQTMLCMCAGQGGKVICDRVVHRSAVSAMALLGIEPLWVSRKVDEKSGLAQESDLVQIEHLLEQNSDVKAVYLTSPDYYGFLQNISKIAKLCHKYNVPLIVDNAHGSHLMFAQKELHPISQGADMSADSVHKTLPVLTGGAWLHINNKKYINSAKDAMAIFGSTSPGYHTMASMDICKNWLKNNGKMQFDLLKNKVKNIINLASKAGIYTPRSKNQDPCRITLGVWQLGYTGYEFREHLYKFGIEPEFCDQNYVVLIPTPFNSDLDWQRLELALQNCPKKRNALKIFNSQINLPEVCMGLREAMTADIEAVKVGETLIGKIAAQIACPCPPGVPIVMPGEKITQTEIEALKQYGITTINVVN